MVASWNQVRHADLVDQFLFYDDLYNGNLWEFRAGIFAVGLETWRVEVCASQELAYGLGWAASFGSSLGMNAEIDRLAASFSGARGELSPDELGATLTPMSSAAASLVASLGATYRFGQAGLLWYLLDLPQARKTGHPHDAHDILTMVVWVLTEAR